MLDSIEKEKIKREIQDKIRSTLTQYRPEISYVPFHFGFWGKHQLTLLPFAKWLENTIAIELFKSIAIIIAQNRFKLSQIEKPTYGFISTESKQHIKNIIEALEFIEREPNKKREIREFREIHQRGKMKKIKSPLVDIWLEKNDGSLFLMKMHTRVPNIENFKNIKHTLLKWTAAEIARNPVAKIHTILAIPYNPYHPQPYQRWRMRGMLDLDQELLVGKELWDFLGGKGTYPDLLDCFERAGIELHSEIDAYFAKFK